MAKVYLRFYNCHILSSSKWHQAMGDELNALQKNGTWSLVPSRSDFNILPKK